MPGTLQKQRGRMAAKQADEARQEGGLRANSKNKDDSQSVDRDLPTASAKRRSFYLPLSFIERTVDLIPNSAYYARWIVRVVEEKTKPNEKRLRECRDSALSLA